MIHALVAGLIMFSPAPLDDPPPPPDPQVTEQPQPNPWLSPTYQRGTCYGNNQVTTWCS